MTIGPVVAVGKEGRRYPERPIVGVLAVVMRDDRALVVRRANPPMSGRWGFPGGVLELGETVAQGAMRELFEETGVTAEAAGPLTVIDTIDRDPDGRVRYHYTLVAVIGPVAVGRRRPRRRCRRGRLADPRRDRRAELADRPCPLAADRPRLTEA